MIYIDIINYIKLLEECKRHKDRMIEMPKAEYRTVYGNNIKGIMFRDKFYSKAEYEEIVKQENDTLENRILKI